MAIDVFKRQGKSAVTGLLGKNLRRISGNIGSVLRGDIGSDSSETAPLNRSKKSTKMLSFPIDIGTDPGLGNNGHYVMFYINEQTNAKLKFGESESESGGSESGQASIANEAKRRGIGDVEKVFDSKKKEFLKKASDPLRYIFKKDEEGNQVNTQAAKKTIHETKESHKIPTTVAINRKPTKRLDTVISLYMPMQVAVKYNSTYGDTKIGAMTSGAVDIAEQLMDTGTLDKAKLEETAKSAGAAMERQSLDMIGALPMMEGLSSAVEMKKGVITTDRMELAFRGIEKRSFAYDFKFMPRSKDEADEIKKIINAFKFNMLPEMPAGQGGRKMTVPNTFDISYMYQNAENNYLHKISTCFLENMDVKYGGSRYKTFDGNADGAPPVETSMSLTFKEIELITREKATEGF